MREVKIKFQENINGLRFLHADRRSLWEYFSMSVITQWQILNHFEMSHIDLFLIYGWLTEGKTIVLKWLPPVLSIWWLTFISKWWWLSLQNDDCCLFEMTMVFSSKWWMILTSRWWWLSLRKIDGFPFDMKMMLFERWDWMPSADFETTVIFLVIEERCCVRSRLLSKG